MDKTRLQIGDVVVYTDPAYPRETYTANIIAIDLSDKDQPYRVDGSGPSWPYIDRIESAWSVNEETRLQCIEDKLDKILSHLGLD